MYINFSSDDERSVLCYRLYENLVWDRRYDQRTGLRPNSIRTFWSNSQLHNVKLWSSYSIRDQTYLLEEITWTSFLPNTCCVVWHAGVMIRATDSRNLIILKSSWFLHRYYSRVTVYLINERHFPDVYKDVIASDASSCWPARCSLCDAVLVDVVGGRLKTQVTHRPATIYWIVMTRLGTPFYLITTERACRLAGDARRRLSNNA